MKKTLILLSIILTAGLLWLNGCKKETAVQQQNTTVTDNEANEAMLQHILDFKQQMEYSYKHPEMRDGESFTAPDAVYELEALLNFNFCYTDIEVNKKRFVSTQITMPLDDMGKIGESKLAQLYYEAIIDSIQARMLSITGFDNMKLLLVDLQQTGTADNGDAIVSIGALVGNEGNVVLHNDNWRYGENAGLCGSGNLAPEDAATQLDARVTNAMVPEPPNGCRWFYTDVVYEYINPTQDTLDYTPDNYIDYKIFYATTEGGLIIDDDVKCLSEYEMNTYEGYYIEYAQNYETETGLKFDHCIITGNPYFEPAYHIQHDYFIYAGNRWLECDTGVGDIFN